MSKTHTPGPWKATGSSANYTPAGDRSDRSNMMDWGSGVDCHAPFTENKYGNYEQVEEQQVARGHGRTAEEARANARLIAAAPELLAELRLSHEIIRVLLNLVPGERRFEMAKHVEEVHDGEGATRFYERAAVIAKASGEAA
jgi:hypothetical protein